MSIRHKLIAGFLATLLIPLLVIGLGLGWQIQQLARDHFVDASGREIAQVDGAMTIFFRGVFDNVDYLATHPTLQKADASIKNYLNAPDNQPMTPSKNGGVEGEIFALFDHFAKTHPGFAYVYMGTKEGGYIQWPEGNTSGAYDPRARPWYKAALAATGKVKLTEAYYWAPDDETIISAVKTIDQAGTVLGVMAIDVSLKGLTEMVKQIRIGETGYLMLIEDSGTVLADSAKPENNFKKLSELSGAAYATLAQANGEVEVEIDGVRYLANVYKSPTLGWKFIGLIEASEVYAESTAMLIKLAVLGLILTLVFVALAIMMSGMIARPIQQVAAGLKDIAEGEGELTKRLTITTKDETAELAHWFNRFLDTIQGLVKQTKESAQGVHQASERAIAVSHEMDAVSQQQLQALEMVSTAFNEMVATANEVANSCVKAAESAQTGQRSVSKGQKMIEDAVVSVNELSQAIRRASGSIEQLEESSNSITTILDVIRGIAEQTNLLALNAAIEAARAGEQGRGFAVVADEVRALAQRTQESTQEINQLLEKLRSGTQQVATEMNRSLHQSEQTVGRTSEAKTSFDEIAEAVEVIKDMNTQIASAAEEQHQVSEDINRNIAQIHTSSNEVADTARQAAANSGKLEDVAKHLNALVGRFKA
ncbi:methyl-accepting chemotaxis protein [Balneatrix alpica]|uniref:Methyl-accepting chemotaxis protein n=1 Tax=Balneatrix alpica TaxID=75684 RepID=A0ABV5ZBG8_9GAMM|nr:methyl-accepting chemotaxis protein [Balneatrix alpica]